VYFAGGYAEFLKTVSVPQNILKNTVDKYVKMSILCAGSQ